MAITKKADRVVSQLKNRISFLKSRRDEVSALSELKSHPGWGFLKSLMEQNIKTNDGKIEMLLSQVDTNPDTFAEARKAQAVKSAVRTYIDCVEKPDEVRNQIDEEITKAQDSLKQAEDEG